MLSKSYRAMLASATAWMGLIACHAEPPAVSNQAPKYSAEVVAKADAIFLAAGLQRTGKSLTAVAAADLSRQLSTLARERRELRLEQIELQTKVRQVEDLETRIRALAQRDRELNLQLAAIATGDVTTNNKIVALINATRSQVTLLREEIATGRELLNQTRGKVNDSEATYAEEVLRIRRSFDAIRKELESKLREDSMRVAIRVAGSNFDVSENIRADDILNPLQKRLLVVEKEVFNEKIPMTQQENGSLVINVAINGKTVPMVVDSGASVVVLPSAIATKLGIPISDDAPVRTVVLANGEKIASRGVTLDRVRVGQFEAEKIDAVVLGAEATSAEALLGMSYLGRFKFELDPTEKSLKMVRVASPTNQVP